MKERVPTLLSSSELVAYLLTRHAFDLFDSAPRSTSTRSRTLLGIHVSETPDARQSDTVGNITLREGRPAEVWINPLENSYVPRRRFTLAHEIGHFCMHGSTDRHEFIDDKNTMNRSESYWNRYESEANRFAATLLMPKELLETIGRKIIDTYKAEHGVAKMPLARFVNSMAARFGVSSPAMEYRLKSLGVGKRG